MEDTLQGAVELDERHDLPQSNGNVGVGDRSDLSNVCGLTEPLDDHENTDRVYVGLTNGTHEEDLENLTTVSTRDEPALSNCGPASRAGHERLLDSILTTLHMCRNIDLTCTIAQSRFEQRERAPITRNYACVHIEDDKLYTESIVSSRMLVQRSSLVPAWGQCAYWQYVLHARVPDYFQDNCYEEDVELPNEIGGVGTTHVRYIPGYHPVEGYYKTILFEMLTKLLIARFTLEKVLEVYEEGKLWAQGWNGRNPQNAAVYRFLGPDQIQFRAEQHVWLTFKHDTEEFLGENPHEGYSKYDWFAPPYSFRYQIEHDQPHVL